MNNYNIHLEIRNPKKPAIDTKFEAMACYLTNRQIDDQTAEERIAGNHRVGNWMSRVRVRSSAAAELCSGEAVVGVARAQQGARWRWCCSKGDAGGGARARARCGCGEGGAARWCAVRRHRQSTLAAEVQRRGGIATSRRRWHGSTMAGAERARHGG